MNPRNGRAQGDLHQFTWNDIIKLWTPPKKKKRKNNQTKGEIYTKKLSICMRKDIKITGPQPFEATMYSKSIKHKHIPICDRISILIEPFSSNVLEIRLSWRMYNSAKWTSHRRIRDWHVFLLMLWLKRYIKKNTTEAKVRKGNQ